MFLFCWSFIGTWAMQWNDFQFKCIQIPNFVMNKFSNFHIIWVLNFFFRFISLFYQLEQNISLHQLCNMHEYQIYLYTFSYMYRIIMIMTIPLVLFFSDKLLYRMTIYFHLWHIGFFSEFDFCIKTCICYLNRINCANIRMHLCQRWTKCLCSPAHWVGVKSSGVQQNWWFLLWLLLLWLMEYGEFILFIKKITNILISLVHLYTNIFISNASQTNGKFIVMSTNCNALLPLPFKTISISMCIQLSQKFIIYMYIWIFHFWIWWCWYIYIYMDEFILHLFTKYTNYICINSLNIHHLFLLFS